MDMTLEQVSSEMELKLTRNRDAGSASLREWKESIDAHIAAQDAEIDRLRKDAERWRHARKILPIEYIASSQDEFEQFGLGYSEHECIAADSAIDAAILETLK